MKRRDDLAEALALVKWARGVLRCVVKALTPNANPRLKPVARRAKRKRRTDA